MNNIVGAEQTGTDRIEFYTGPYAANYEKDCEAAISEFIEAAIKGGEILTLTGTHDTNQFMIMLVSLASMLTCVVLAYVVEKLINWENY